ncbi:MAG: hypothetical protein HY753_08125 [Nitrospirae bacterium]|nr:hypothetical protein [Nitrospirota bacterium]
MRILILRAWNVVPYSATFSTIHKIGVGGTELQLLMHARAFRELGHEVEVMGVTREDVVEEGIIFKGTGGKEHLLGLLKEKYVDTDIVFTNVKDGLSELRMIMPTASIIEVCQNGPHFYNDEYIDIYAFVGYGQFAYYTAKFKKYRHKFMMLPNIPPYYKMYSKSESVAKEDQIIWIGSVNKQGFRRWAKAMQEIMRWNETIKWVICCPSYDQTTNSRLPSALFNIDLPFERIAFKSMPLSELALEIKRSRIVLASLGGEDGPVSYLDGHALGVPVLCGNDIYGKFYNPEGIGLRCTTVSECVKAIKFLLENPDICETMGKMGIKWIMNNTTENHQEACIEQIISYVMLKRRFNIPEKSSIQSDKKFSLRFWLERAEIRLSKIFG